MWVESGPVAIPEEAIQAAVSAALEHFEMPFMARARDFTAAQVEAGELQAADAEAARKNRAAVEAVVAPAAPLIVAAELDEWAKQVHALGQEQRSIHVGHLLVDLRRRASVLRGEGDPQ